MNFGIIIRTWYKKNKRDLPWRHTKDPYKIWISEVILQQTRVNQGLSYYLEFVESFPDVASLAAAHEDDVLKKWQGLGYYSRARNLHHAAKYVEDQMEGRIPVSYEGLLSLKGVGNYTASAIASICFGEPRPVVDGNVSRVISRLFGVEEPVNNAAGGKKIALLADQLMDSSDPGTHNQAIMEFGALQCVPVSPHCKGCPLFNICTARITGRVEDLPAKISKKKPVVRWMEFYILLNNDHTILIKRGNQDIWKSLYQFPLVESDMPFSESPLPDAPLGRDATILKISDPVKHQLTHRTIHARFIHAMLPQWPDPLPAGWLQIPLTGLDYYPVPRLIHRYMESVKFSYL